MNPYDGDQVKEWAGDSQFRAWRADLSRFKKHGYSGWGSEGFWALTIYRLQRCVDQRSPRIVWLPVRMLLGLFKKFFTLITHINLCKEAEIGPGMLIPHVGPIQVFPWALIARFIRYAPLARVRGRVAQRSAIMS